MTTIREAIAKQDAEFRKKDPQYSSIVDRFEKYETLLYEVGFAQGETITSSNRELINYLAKEEALLDALRNLYLANAGVLVSAKN